MTVNRPYNQRLPLWGAAFTSLLCILFGANAVAIKMTLSGLGVFTTAGLRFGIAAIVIFIWAKATGRSFIIRNGQFPQLLIISVIFILQLSILYLGLKHTDASRATLLINLQPFFVMFLAHYFIPGDRITRRKIVGLIMGFAGMAFVVLGEGVSPDVETGDLLILATAFLWACNATYTKKVIDSFDPFQVVFYPMILSVPFFFVGALLWDETMIARVDQRILGSLVYQSLVTASFGFVAWNHLLQRYGAVALHSFIFLMPVAGVMLGGLVLGEPITFNILAATSLIVSGIVVVNLKTAEYAPIFPQRGL